MDFGKNQFRKIFESSLPFWVDENRSTVDDIGKGLLNTIKVFAEVLLWDVEVCRRTEDGAGQKVVQRSNSWPSYAYVFYKTCFCVSCQDKNTTLLLEENKKGLLY